ncbi:hypothetical protein TEQG_08170 [Trichophyton equinum CBS 127.97]|uniref:Uncharacterized protein n=1 Tax=Trichophyton equinum (strain ATCC MYA-4606 / CBS 127.97) TaxID=559882 RepID=F2Q503_TRIEC|nr:hypothetical protein TEQG_08170 [Trichophyton equinum CBS 127.97]
MLRPMASAVSLRLRRAWKDSQRGSLCRLPQRRRQLLGFHRKKKKRRREKKYAAGDTGARDPQPTQMAAPFALLASLSASSGWRWVTPWPHRLLPSLEMSNTPPHPWDCETPVEGPYGVIRTGLRAGSRVIRNERYIHYSI